MSIRPDRPDTDGTTDNIFATRWLAWARDRAAFTRSLVRDGATTTAGASVLARDVIQLVIHDESVQLWARTVEHGLERVAATVGRQIGGQMGRASGIDHEIDIARREAALEWVRVARHRLTAEAAADLLDVL